MNATCIALIRQREMSFFLTFFFFFLNIIREATRSLVRGRLTGNFKEVSATETWIFKFFLLRLFFAQLDVSR